MAPSYSPDMSFYGSEVESTLKLLAEGSEKVRLDERYRNVNLVFGIAGAGKSTFVRWIAGDNSKLVSELVPGTRNSFIVMDKANNSTTQSIFPQLVVDPQTDAAYYDCPTFSATQSVSADIAGTYFVKSVADYVQNVRLLFVIDYAAVRVGMDRRRFFKFLKHSNKLVKNLDKFRDSIALVVTKVDNTSNKGNGQIPDERIINSIANFMKSVREELQQGEHEDLIKFIDVLLQRDGDGSYSKIAIFRRPDMAGPLSDIPLLQKDKVKVLEKVKQLELTPIEDGDFDYSISNSSMNDAFGLMIFLNERMWQEAETITIEAVPTFVEQFIEDIRNRIISITATESTAVAHVEEAQTFAAKLRAVGRIVSELSVPDVTTKELAKKLNFTLNALQIDGTILRDSIEQIRVDAKHLEFIQKVTDTQSFTKPWHALLTFMADRLSTFNEGVQYQSAASAGALVFIAQSNVYEIADNLREAKLSQQQLADIQPLLARMDLLVRERNPTDFQPTNIKQLASDINKNLESLDLETSVIRKNVATLFNLANYLTYVQTINDAFSPEWSTSPSVSSPPIDTIVSQPTFKHISTAQRDCTNGDLIVSGDIVKLSNLKQRLADECPNRISSVNIFATNTVLIDSDLDGQGDELKLTVVAPKWEVVGQRRINLDGAPGSKPNPPKARNSNSAGISPEKGQPGFPGGSAGTFVGIAQQFINREGLTISANGGVGGDGQDGGDGGDGVKGSDAQRPDSQCVITGPYEVTSTRIETHGITQYNFTDYLIHGSSGTSGGIGGDGGAGGPGGRSGVIELFNLSDSTKQQIPTNQGNDGSGGRGGLGGYDGLHGDDLKANCQFYLAFGNWRRKLLSSQTITYDRPNRAPNGADGANRDAVRNPEATSLIVQAADPMTEHKKRLRSILNGEKDRFTALSGILDQFWQVDEGSLSSSVQAESAPLIDCTPDGNLVVTGDLVKFSELRQNLLDVCPNRINSVNIIASDTVLIDRDLDVQGDKLKFTVVAPKWEVVGQRRINLDGSVGRQHKYPKARNSNITEISPENGQPGYPGGSAGSFLGVGHQFVNWQDLTISANGGVGGDGQDGGDGGDGVKGADAQRPNSECLITGPYEVTSTRIEVHGFTQYNFTDYFIRGSSGMSGGIGGDGGAGGAGGRRGVIELFNLSDSTKHQIPTNQGSDGSGGRGGLGGYDGLHGDDLKANCQFYLAFGNWKRKFLSSQTITYDHTNRAPNGTDGANRDGILLPEATYLRVNADSDRMAEHIKELRSNFNDPGLSTILDRLEQINSPPRMLRGSQQSPQKRDWFKPYLSEIFDHTQAPPPPLYQHQKKLNNKLSNSLHRSSDSTGALSHASRIGEAETNTQIAHPRFENTKHRNANTNMAAVSNSVDVHGNLLLSQLLVGLIAGKNQTISSESSYISPEQTRNLQVDTLAQQVLPVLSQSSENRWNQNNDDNTQWHRDLFPENDTIRERN